MERSIAPIDIDYLTRLRSNVEKFMQDAGFHYSKQNALLLDVAPQNHKGAKPFLIQM